MSESQEQLKALSEIRSMMERSSRFISLSGLSGIIAGIFALCGVYAAYYLLKQHRYNFTVAGIDTNIIELLFFIAILVLVAALSAGLLLTIRQSRRNGQLIWDAAARRLFYNLAIPLTAGGLFCLVLLYHNYYFLIAPATLMFYGLALLNASKYTLDDIRYLGLCEIALGLMSALYIGYGLVFWAIGFGVLHIVYGVVMYYKYERK